MSSPLAGHLRVGPRKSRHHSCPRRPQNPGREVRFLDWKQDEAGHESVQKCLLWPSVCLGERKEPLCVERGEREGTHALVCACVHLCVPTSVHMYVCVVSLCLHVPTYA